VNTRPSARLNQHVKGIRAVDRITDPTSSFALRRRVIARRQQRRTPLNHNDYIQSPATRPSFSHLTFADLGLAPTLVRALSEQGYAAPTAIQAKAVPEVLAGRDVFGAAPTGTGKTAAFALPILQKLTAAGLGRTNPRFVRVLVLSPTRELAAQIAESFTAYGRHTGIANTAIFGGVSQNAQIRALRSGVDVVVATPGRLCDLLGQNVISLANVEVLVLDEADRMLDMGFLPDVRRILARVPKRRQTLLFSATMPAPILELAQTILVSPVQVAVARSATVASNIDQAVYFVDQSDKRALLEHLLCDERIARALVFTRTKHGANRVAQQLSRASVQAEAIHGNKSQNARTRALARFKSGSLRVLVATDIAARGIDVEGVSHVINYDLPAEPESYVHRIGRTARAGAAGIALTFCGPEQRHELRGIERLIRSSLLVVDHPYAPYQRVAPAHSHGPGPSRSHVRGRASMSSGPSAGRRTDVAPEARQ
jgi:ATP-dependent RNA helicase RhlE